MTQRVHRPQKSDRIDLGDLKPVVVRPLENLDDRRNNPKDIEPDRLAMANGMEHGGTIETRAEALHERGSGGRKRSQNSAADNKHAAGRDKSKRRAR
jgi:hypothetical protein